MSRNKMAIVYISQAILPRPIVYITKMSKNDIYRQNFEILREIYFLQLLKLEKIKCCQKYNFLTLNMFYPCII